MTKWIRFNYKQDISLFGTLAGNSVDEYEGDLFENPKPTGRKIPFNEALEKRYLPSVEYIEDSINKYVETNEVPQAWWEERRV